MKPWSTVIVSALAVGLAAYAGYLSIENSRLKALLAETQKVEMPITFDGVAETTEEVVETAEEIEQPRRRGILPSSRTCRRMRGEKDLRNGDARPERLRWKGLWRLLMIRS